MSELLNTRLPPPVQVVVPATTGVLDKVREPDPEMTPAKVVVLLTDTAVLFARFVRVAVLVKVMALPAKATGAKVEPPIVTALLMVRAVAAWKTPPLERPGYRCPEALLFAMFKVTAVGVNETSPALVLVTPGPVPQAGTTTVELLVSGPE